MGYFDADFAAADDLWSEAFGEAVVYIDAAGEETPEPLAIVSSETVREIKISQGIEKVREREVSLRVQIIAQPQLNATVRVGNEVWPIESIAGQDKVRTRVILQLPVLRERTRPGYRNRG